MRVVSARKGKSHPPNPRGLARISFADAEALKRHRRCPWWRPRGLECLFSSIEELGGDDESDLKRLYTKLRGCFDAVGNLQRPSQEMLNLMRLRDLFFPPSSGKVSICAILITITMATLHLCDEWQ